MQAPQQYAILLEYAVPSMYRAKSGAGAEPNRGANLSRNLAVAVPSQAVLGLLRTEAINWNHSASQELLQKLN